MVKIDWIITDDLTNISLEEFDYEWNGIISGYFELDIAHKKIGFCPNVKIENEGCEDILYWLSHLSEGVMKIKEGNEYEMILLTMNVYKLVMKLEGKMHICFINKKSSEIKWRESVELLEFETELYKSVKRFLQVLEETNPELLKSRWIEKLLLIT